MVSLLHRYMIRNIHMYVWRWTHVPGGWIWKLSRSWSPFSKVRLLLHRKNLIESAKLACDPRVKFTVLSTSGILRILIEKSWHLCHLTVKILSRLISLSYWFLLLKCIWKNFTQAFLHPKLDVPVRLYYLNLSKYPHLHLQQILRPLPQWLLQWLAIWALICLFPGVADNLTHRLAT